MIIKKKPNDVDLPAVGVEMLQRIFSGRLSIDLSKFQGSGVVGDVPACNFFLFFNFLSFLFIFCFFLFRLFKIHRHYRIPKAIMIFH
jgi:hypothetical protein